MVQPKAPHLIASRSEQRTGTRRRRGGLKRCGAVGREPRCREATQGRNAVAAHWRAYRPIPYSHLSGGLLTPLPSIHAAAARRLPYTSSGDPLSASGALGAHEPQRPPRLRDGRPRRGPRTREAAGLKRSTATSSTAMTGNRHNFVPISEPCVICGATSQLKQNRCG